VQEEDKGQGKNIILSSDGTGNTGGKKYNTNVWNIHTAIDRNDYELWQASKQQVSFYDDGVGTDQLKWLKLLGGAFGLGLAKNVKELYTFLVYNYEEGDSIYLFGFSRGGFTIRLLADIICSIGILRPSGQTDQAIDQAVRQVYRRLRYENFTLKWWSSQNLCQYGISMKSGIKIEFIGIWDTVEAYAIPSQSLSYFINQYIYSFQRSKKILDCNIKKICHVLAIDDKRRIFHPILWDEKDHTHDHQNTDKVIEQVWFSGSHANVGGGYPKQGLAWTSLSWMMEKAKLSGLRFAKEDHEQYIENCDYNDHLYDSRAGLACIYTYKPRDIQSASEAHHTEALIHISTFQRILYRTRNYAPINLPSKFKIVDARPFDAIQQDSMNRLSKEIQARIKTHNILETHQKKYYWFNQLRSSQHRFIPTVILVFIAIALLSSIAMLDIALVLTVLSFIFMLFSWGINWIMDRDLQQSARKLWSESLNKDNWDVIKHYRFSHQQYPRPNSIQPISHLTFCTFKSTEITDKEASKTQKKRA
jgi:uncharacterized protein (DUF2235 family)